MMIKTTLQNMQGTVKARLRRFIASNAYVRKEKLKISDLDVQLRKLEK